MISRSDRLPLVSRDEVDVELHVVRGKSPAVVLDHEADARHHGLELVLRQIEDDALELLARHVGL